MPSIILSAEYLAKYVIIEQGADMKTVLQEWHDHIPGPMQ